MQAIGRLLEFAWDERTLALRAAGADLYITVLAGDLVRVELVPQGAGRATDSYAVVKQVWPACPVTLADEPARLVLRAAVEGGVAGHAPGGAAESAQGASGGAAGLGVVVEVFKDPVRIAIRRADGSLVAACAPDGGFRWDAEKTEWRMAAPPGWCYYGFGQKPGFLEKRGRRMEQWATDEVLHIMAHDQLYQAIPFFVTLEPAGGRSTGVFVDCTARVVHDVAKAEPDVCSVTAYSSPLDAYVFAGPGPKDVVARYTELTGRMELPPLWALGYHQSRYSYESAERVREIAREMRARDIPCDVIHLDIDYMDGYRVFTWNRERFPDPKGLAEELAGQGIRLVPIVDPGVKLDGQYEVFRDGVAKGCFICRPDGELFVGTVWPGPTVFPDFTRAHVRKWWGDWHRALVQDVGVAGIWNDMNEPSLFARNTLPDDAVQGEDGRRVPHAKVHNAYGMTMDMATHAALRRLAPDRRPFVLSRSGYAGVQRYAAVWMGDNHSWWEHLLWAMPMCLGMGLCGVPFVGTDIGGFSGDANGELLARWTQMGALMPFCRNHSCVGTAAQEPWAFGPEVEAICREYLKLRYQLLPFLYNEFYKSSRTGLPIMRPLFLEYPSDPATHHVSDQFLVGEDVLVCPVYQPGATHRMVYLPHGAWVDFWTGRRHAGPVHIVAEAPLERMPIFVRDGAIVPMEPPVRHTGERDGRELILRAYAGASGRLALYEDAGEGYGYTRGESAITEFAIDCAPAGAGVAEVRLAAGAPQGGFRPPRERVTVHLYAPGQVRSVAVDGRPAPWTQGPAGSAMISIPTPGAAGFTLVATVETTLEAG